MRYVPNLNPDTGVSEEFFSQLYGLHHSWDDMPSHIKLLRLQESPIERYTDRFPQSVYHDPVTFSNQDVVSRLDAIADEMNSLATHETYSEDRLRDLVIEAHRLVYAEPSYLEQMDDSLVG